MTSAPSYSATYDAAGSQTARNGQAMTYDMLRRLTHWQNTASNPTSTADYAYNGSGERVQQVTATTSGGVTTTTTTMYIGGYEEAITSVQTGTCSPACATVNSTTKYYQTPVMTGEVSTGTLYYLVNDGLGSVSMTLTIAGTVQAYQLFLPFGSSRYSSGSMPTSYGFTNQRLDPSGLNYYHARYYDSSVGQFASADSVQGPNRYAYVGGNPETVTDPTGNCWIVCAIIAAVVVAVVAAVVDVVVQEVQHPGTVDWGQVATVGLVSGAIAGAVFILGPLAVGAVAGAVDGGGVVGALGAVGTVAAQGLATDAAIVSIVATPWVIAGVLGADRVAGIVSGATSAFGIGVVDHASTRGLIEGTIIGGLCGTLTPAGLGSTACGPLAEALRKGFDSVTGGDASGSDNTQHPTATSATSPTGGNADNWGSIFGRRSGGSFAH